MDQHSRVSTGATLATPLLLPNGTVIPNRLAKAAMSETLASWDNRPTANLLALYRRWSRSGLGLIITGNVMVDRRAIGEPRNVVIEDRDDIKMLQAWSAAAKAGGAAAWVQLNHPGKQAAKGLNAETIAPSAVPFGKDAARLFATPREATDSEIRDIIARFGRSAAICREAGFDGVQIHGAHGYLISQFLSPHHNRRTDQWGGTPPRRRRFVLEVLAAVRRAVGPDFPVGIKLNSADFQRGGVEADDALATIAALEQGGIDLIEISGGTYESPAMNGAARWSASTRAREAYFLDFAERARAASAVPLMVTGGFRTVAAMNAALDAGVLDVVGLARPLAIEPDLAGRLLRGLDGAQSVRPIRTGIGFIDRIGLMEVLWFTEQLGRMARGRDPKPDAPALTAFLRAAWSSGWGAFRSRRARQS